ncbi:AAA family ATPase [Paenibacillus xylanexedens]|uniref:AAA family ATPase n=1 Tax=Paenibacillus xylanexedens TaxID=528191 RepID=UPI000F52A3C4|nr:AAA family ATPase [Paenibacillus xylanexedens]RPK27833.1 hypothetical protein EDO6_03356 [Paenibacillus xylanexedens]
MKHPIFLSGPHGSGKTTLLNKLKEKHNIFYENDFDIDFLKEFPNIRNLSDFERCLIRLYHRIYLTNYAGTLAASKSENVIITSRGIYDSAAYISTYRKLNWFEEQHFERLKFILENSGYQPYTIVLNPPPEVVAARLDGRRKEGTRKTRDDVFLSEDSYEFIENICQFFSGLRDMEHILYIEDNTDSDIERILSWVDEINADRPIFNIR